MTETKKCRICKGENLVKVLDLGDQELTGVFPSSPTKKLTHGNLDLVWCKDCSLLQMGHDFPLDEMYGMNYGYRSGLNASMVEHLTNKVHWLEKLANLKMDDMVIDIGSNDCTTLKAYTVPCMRLGVDPTGMKFSEFYPRDVHLIADFFPTRKIEDLFGGQKAKIITSIAMFYDLPDPAAFVEGIKQTLAPDGIWHLEQSYMPKMVRQLAYDTVCHEHLEFYSFNVIRMLLEKAGMRVVDVQTNDINGGSFAVTACLKGAPYEMNWPVVTWMTSQEERLKFDNPFIYRAFEAKVKQHKRDLLELLEALVGEGKTIFGYGASTKGNVMLQYCGIDTRLVPYIADVNPDKFGCYTPGTHIPIISEKKAKEMNPDYFLVFPWHFRTGILEREKEWRKNGGKFIFPLPEIEIV